MSALTAAPEKHPGGEDGQPADHHNNHSSSPQQEEEQDGVEEEAQHRQLQLLKETARELEQERFEEEEREARLRALRLLTPEEYLRQTGVSGAMEEALGAVASLRPFDPVNLFSDM